MKNTLNVNIALVVMLSVALCSCSNKQLYKAGQEYQQSACIEKAATEGQYNDCIQSQEKTFEQYQRERNEALTKQN
ncbi:hypothetical protein [Colwellia echini]|uniref:Lipoprotein n=1 Tax=Colwellia echini TaxID=1982103 RepID=A0ABY3MVE2_9GAMM|nr:hypothetical protein [Colwellia echini]TYK65159.1 hypothetical protein CWS31_011850 [Colwellia echini]